MKSKWKNSLNLINLTLFIILNTNILNMKKIMNKKKNKIMNKILKQIIIIIKLYIKKMKMIKNKDNFYKIMMKIMNIFN